MLLTRRRVVVILPHRLDSSRGEAGARQGKAVRPATEDVVPLLFYSPPAIRKSIGHYNRPALAIYRLHYVHRLSFSCLSCLSSVKSIFSISRYTEDKCYATAKQRNGHASPAARQNNSTRAPQFIDMRIRVGISKESLFLFFSFVLVSATRKLTRNSLHPLFDSLSFSTIELKSQQPKSDLTRYDRRRYLSIAKPGKSNKKHKTRTSSLKGVDSALPTCLPPNKKGESLK